MTRPTLIAPLIVAASFGCVGCAVETETWEDEIADEELDGDDYEEEENVGEAASELVCDSTDAIACGDLGAGRVGPRPSTGNGPDPNTGN